MRTDLPSLARRVLRLCVLFVALCGLSPLFSAEPDFDALLRELDRNATFESQDFSCTFTMVSEKPGEETQVLQAKFFRRDRSKEFTIIVVKPDVQKGTGYFRSGDNFWVYDPESRRFSHTSMRENFEDSEVRNSDFQTSTLAQDYRVEGYTEGKLGAHEVYILDLRAKRDDVAYAQLKLFIRKDKRLVLKAESWSQSGRLMRSTYYTSYVKIGERYIANKLLVVDELVKGERTQMTMEDISVAALDNAVFNKSFLEQVGR